MIKHREKLEIFRITLICFEGFWVIAKSPVSDALPGDKNVIGGPLADQLSFG